MKVCPKCGKAGKNGASGIVLDGKLKIYIAHRIAWEFTYGPIPADRDVCHSCDAAIEKESK